MIRIESIHIKRFRSINDLTLNIDSTYNIVTVCGQNNVGKTNILRAISLFLIKPTLNLVKTCLSLSK
jgi:AAA15 family ATPase/GTPase